MRSNLTGKYAWSTWFLLTEASMRWFREGWWEKETDWPPLVLKCCLTWYTGHLPVELTLSPPFCALPSTAGSWRLCSALQTPWPATSQLHPDNKGHIPGGGRLLLAQLVSSQRQVLGMREPQAPGTLAQAGRALGTVPKQQWQPVPGPPRVLRC